MDVEELKRLVIYDPLTGAMTRTDKRTRSIAGSERKNLSMMIHYKIYQRNQVAWAIAHGHFHDGRIYHLDRDPFNFALNNLSTTKPKGKRL